MAIRNKMFLPRFRCFVSDSSGGLLLEVVVALSLFSLVGEAIMMGLSTVHKSSSVTSEQSVAENVARNQMEQVFSLAYQVPPTSYPSVATPPGFGVTAASEEYVPGDPNMEKLVVTVSH